MNDSVICSCQRRRYWGENVVLWELEFPVNIFCVDDENHHKKQEHQANKELKRPDCTTGANVYPIKGLLPNLQFFFICQYDNNGFDTRFPE